MDITKTIIINKNAKKKRLLASITQIVDELINTNEIFHNINKVELLDFIEKLIAKQDNSLIDELNFVSKDEFIKRIKEIMMWEAMIKVFNEMTEEQIKAFDEATQRIPLFQYE